MHTYKETERGLWTVVFYLPSGEFFPLKDFPSPDMAADHAHFLNGGNEKMKSVVHYSGVISEVEEVFDELQERFDSVEICTAMIVVALKKTDDGTLKQLLCDAFGEIEKRRENATFTDK